MTRLRPSQLGAAERLWSLVPAWDRAEDERNEGSLRDLLRGLGLGLDAARDDILRVLDNAFVDTCQPELVPLIGRLVGVRVHGELPVHRQRRVVKRALSDRSWRGTVRSLESLSWDVTGARCAALEQIPRGQSDARPPWATRITGRTTVRRLPAAMTLTGASVRLVGRVVRPVRRRQQRLVRLGAPGLFGIAPGSGVPLATSRGTGLLRGSRTEGHVGRGSDVDLVSHGPIALPTEAFFVPLAEGAVPACPRDTVLIDPRTGRVGVHPGLGIRHLHMSWWEPLGASLVTVRPEQVDAGTYSFSETRSADSVLVDAYNRTVTARTPAPTGPAVLLEPVPGGRTRVTELPGSTVSLVDTAGLRRFFRFEDAWGADAFRTIHLGLTSRTLSDDTVEVDVDQGVLRVNGTLDPNLRAHIWRPFHAEAQRAALEETATARMPIGRSVQAVLRDRGHRHPETTP